MGALNQYLFCVCGLLLIPNTAFVMALRGFGRLTRNWGLSGVSGPSLTQLSAVRHRTTRLNNWEIEGQGKKRPKRTKGQGKGKGKKVGIPDLHERDVNLAQGKEIQNGLVIERLGDRLLIQPYKDPVRSIICSQRSRLCDATVVVGDRVDFFEFEGDKDAENSEASQEENIGKKLSTYGDLKGVVVSHHARKNVLQRPSGGGNIRLMKSIAANVDQLMLVVSGSPLVPLVTVDRMMVAAHKYDMRCILVLNKVDSEATGPFRHNILHYKALGYRIIEVSSKTGQGMDELRDSLRHNNSIFVGQSGVGKSSLVNALLPNANARVGALVRSTNQIGAHTTSSSHLFHLGGPADPEAGTIIDSPGIREIGLWHLSVDDIKEGFVEIHAHAKNCKFRNCTHEFDQEGCAIIKALEEGRITTRRYSSFKDLTDA